ncbi:DUF4124 domain-containing protein [Piscinibacter sakaiensis]|uniref:DUF4124 domain-containing protein n=1 Tax=Piscinibacter sakaiensis TaxID=1547922 RepID=A0A0K8P014_PISS1|nr:DUF4124 domain-containing protein [Piscinibacter sakaiensis]GAP35968.1 hypothetical protein ISF6_1808 [Piscinibacter sakaiensis]
MTVPFPAPSLPPRTVPGPRRAGRGLLALLVVAGATLALPVPAQTIYRWTDDAGQVHYGDQVPDRYKTKARALSVKESTPAGSGFGGIPRRAEGRPVPAAPGASAAPTLSTTPPGGGAAPLAGTQRPGTAPATAGGSGGTGCADQWRRYEASGACFAPFRNANGSIKAEAFQQCQEVQRPSCQP